MDLNARAVILTGRHKDQCVRWDCRRLALTPLEYCSECCQEMATSDSRSNLPFFLSNVYSSTTEFAKISAKIFMMMNAGKETGIPQLPPDVFQIPPWQSSNFSVEFSEWEVYRQWLFIGSSQIPATSDFNWVEDSSRVMGEVRHCVLKPFPREDNIWELHQYSSLDLMRKAVYVMRCNKFGEPLSAAEEDEKTDSD